MADDMVVVEPNRILEVKLQESDVNLLLLLLGDVQERGSEQVILPWELESIRNGLKKALGITEEGK